MANHHGDLDLDTADRLLSGRLGADDAPPLPFAGTRTRTEPFSRRSVTPPHALPESTSSSAFSASARLGSPLAASQSRRRLMVRQQRSPESSPSASSTASTSRPQGRFAAPSPKWSSSSRSNSSGVRGLASRAPRPPVAALAASAGDSASNRGFEAQGVPPVLHRRAPGSSASAKPSAPAPSGHAGRATRGSGSASPSGNRPGPAPGGPPRRRRSRSRSRAHGAGDHRHEGEGQPQPLRLRPYLGHPGLPRIPRRRPVAHDRASLARRSPPPPTAGSAARRCTRAISTIRILSAPDCRLRPPCA